MGFKEWEIMTRKCPNCKSMNDDDKVICQECGYELNITEIDDRRKKTPKNSRPISNWWNNQSKRNKITIGITGVFIIGLLCVGAVGSMISSANQNNINTTITTPTAYNVFSNQYVQFTYPNNMVVRDMSTDNQCTVYIYSGNPSHATNLDPKFAGDISNVASNYMISITDPTVNINLNGTQAIEFNDSQLNSYNLFVPSKNLLLEIGIKQKLAYNTIKNSLIIK